MDILLHLFKVIAGKLFNLNQQINTQLSELYVLFLKLYNFKVLKGTSCPFWLSSFWAEASPHPLVHRPGEVLALGLLREGGAPCHPHGGGAPGLLIAQL
jgi:hypothetical protein